MSIADDNMFERIDFSRPNSPFLYLGKHDCINRISEEVDCMVDALGLTITLATDEVTEFENHNAIRIVALEDSGNGLWWTDRAFEDVEKGETLEQSVANFVATWGLGLADVVWMPVYCQHQPHKVSYDLKPTVAGFVFIAVADAVKLYGTPVLTPRIMAKIEQDMKDVLERAAAYTNHYLYALILEKDGAPVEQMTGIYINKDDDAFVYITDIAKKLIAQYKSKLMAAA